MTVSVKHAYKTALCVAARVAGVGNAFAKHACFLRASFAVKIGCKQIVITSDNFVAVLFRHNTARNGCSTVDNDRTNRNQVVVVYQLARVIGAST